MPEIRLRNVRKVYSGGIYALDGVNLDLEQGDFLSVVGASGCGKTTLLKCIAGLEPITAGELLIEGEIANLTRVQERKVGIVFQEFTLYPNMSVFENIAFALKKQNMSYDEIVQRVRDIMEKMDLMNISAQMPKELSYGQKQKVSLARALVKNPDIILFDEPLSNIDEMLKREYRQFIVRTKELFPNSTYIYVTHNLHEALSMGNKLLVMDDGKVVQYGGVRQLFEYPCNRTVLEALHQNVTYSDCVIRDGFIISGDEKIELSPLQKLSIPETGEISATCAKYDGYASCFDDDGNAILGVLDRISFPVKVNDEMISVFDKAFSVEPIKEGLLCYGKGTAVLAQRNFSFSYIPDSLELEGIVEYRDREYICVGLEKEKLFLPLLEGKEEQYCVGDKVTLFYPITELELYDESGNRMLSQYALNDNVIEAKVVSSHKGIIKIGNRKLRLNLPLPQKTVRLHFSRDAFSITSDEKKGLEIQVLNEEYCNGQTLVHAEIKGGQSYLTMSFQGRVKMLGNYKNYVTVDLEKVKVVQ